MKYFNTIPEEQESIINIDYSKKEATLYSSRKNVIQRLYAKLGEPTKTYYIKGALTGASWDIKFSDKKRMTIAFSRPTLIGQIK